MSSRYALEVSDTEREEVRAGRTAPASRPSDMPAIGPHGLVTFRGYSVCLSERNALLAAVFIYHFNAELTDLVLLDRVWPEGATHWTVRLCLRRLDRRLRRVGLTIVEVGEHARSMRAVDDL